MEVKYSGNKFKICLVLVEFCEKVQIYHYNSSIGLERLTSGPRGTPQVVIISQITEPG